MRRLFQQSSKTTLPETSVRLSEPTNRETISSSSQAIEQQNAEAISSLSKFRLYGSLFQFFRNIAVTLAVLSLVVAGVATAIYLTSATLRNNPTLMVEWSMNRFAITGDYDGHRAMMHIVIFIPVLLVIAVAALLSAYSRYQQKKAADSLTTGFPH